jgi:hypothetical protein
VTEASNLLSLKLPALERAACLWMDRSLTQAVAGDKGVSTAAVRTAWIPSYHLKGGFECKTAWHHVSEWQVIAVISGRNPRALFARANPWYSIRSSRLLRRPALARPICNDIKLRHAQSLSADFCQFVKQLTRLVDSDLH